MQEDFRQYEVIYHGQVKEDYLRLGITHLCKKNRMKQSETQGAEEALKES